ncbi:hypothetical protein [Helicobacter sp. WB40]|uniref:hypothetical protein n=1 Tax=Helicobacter sp. WB40 TaxID=3004130 RepID=UPI0022EBD91E|nr:hypothetical protein [Helicobacter sp. WB40]MDA3967084.1 hypothetical protein [Helicobacter sp. WB40]
MINSISSLNNFIYRGENKSNKTNDSLSLKEASDVISSFTLGGTTMLKGNDKLLLAGASPDSFSYYGSDIVAEVSYKAFEMKATTRQQVDAAKDKLKNIMQELMNEVYDSKLGEMVIESIQHEINNHDRMFETGDVMEAISLLSSYSYLMFNDNDTNRHQNDKAFGFGEGALTMNDEECRKLILDYESGLVDEDTFRSQMHTFTRNNADNLFLFEEFFSIFEGMFPDKISPDMKSEARNAMATIMAHTMNAEGKIDLGDIVIKRDIEGGFAVGNLEIIHKPSSADISLQSFLLSTQTNMQKSMFDVLEVKESKYDSIIRDILNMKVKQK